MTYAYAPNGTVMRLAEQRISERWLPVRDAPALYDPETEHLVFSHYTVTKIAVTRHFRVEPIEVNERIAALTTAVEALAADASSETRKTVEDAIGKPSFGQAGG